jgi:integrating conjugative element protein (TIGR03759 family)
VSNRHLRLIALGLALSHAVSAVGAEPTITELNSSTVEQTPTVETPLSPAEAARAEIWGLAPSEWQRYRSLMQGIRGSISPATLSPIEVLGIHARDEAERRRYAEAWARAMHEDVARVLAFQRAYDEAGRRLYPGQLLIDPARVPKSESKTPDLQPGDRLLFFARTDCASCDALLARMLRRLDRIAGIDLYLVGLKPGDEPAVRDWAAEHDIRRHWVSRRQVTLNFDGGTLDRLGQGEAELPLVMRRRGDEITPLAASSLR